MSYTAKEIAGLVGKAIHERDMIHNGDHVLCAVSGGKDSLSLLWLLRERLERIPISYRLTAVHVDPGFGAGSGERLAAFFEEEGFSYTIISSDIGPRAHGPENRENPCFLCARLRRRLLFEAAESLDSKVLAFGHHKDDIIETFFINLFYGGSLSTMNPVQRFFGGNLRIIRPLYRVEEALVDRYARSMGWETIPLGCPTAGSSKRQEIKDLLKGLYRSNRKIKGNVFHALHNVRRDYLL